MLKSLKRKVDRLERILRRKQFKSVIVLVQPGETREEAKERYFREHPEDRDCGPYIVLSLGLEAGVIEAQQSPEDGSPNPYLALFPHSNLPKSSEM